MYIKKKVATLCVALATILSLHYNQKLIITNRELSINLGDGRCEWVAPIYEMPNTTFFKTLIAGYPSGDKRLTFVQMEALTGLSARDEWDFKVRIGHLRNNHVTK